MDQLLPSTSSTSSTDLNFQNLPLYVQLNLINSLKRTHTTGAYQETDTVKRQCIGHGDNECHPKRKTEQNEQSTSSDVPTSMETKQFESDTIQAICQQMYLAKVQTTTSQSFMNLLGNNNLQQTHANFPLITLPQQFNQSSCSTSSITPLLSQIFASARLSQTTQTPRNQIEEKTSPTNIEEPSSSNTENYMQTNLLEAAARLAFSSIMILEMERKALGFAEPSPLTAKYIAQLNLTQIPMDKMQLIQHEINNLTSPLFPALVKPYTTDGAKLSREMPQVSQASQPMPVTNFQHEFHRQVLRQLLNIYEKQIENFIIGSELASLVQVKLNNIERRHVKDQHRFFQTLTTIPETGGEQKAHHLRELLNNSSTFNQLKKSEENSRN